MLFDEDFRYLEDGRICNKFDFEELFKFKRIKYKTVKRMKTG